MKKFVLALTFFVLAIVTSQATDKPNIVIFLADDLGWADVGWHGTEIKTPNLDKLADSGLKLEQFYVQQVCWPTRAALMTGRHPYLRYNMSGGPPTNERTLAQALREAGYYTAITGKWHLGQVPEKVPLQRGFDYHYGFYGGTLDYYEHAHQGKLDWQRNGQPVHEEGYSTDLLAEDAVRIVKNHDTSKPLFLYVPFNAVHAPYLPPPDKELYEQYPNLTRTRKIYAGMVASMDNAIGKIVKALEEKGIKDNTLIFFASDNGGPHPKAITDNGPLRGEKMSLYEGGIRVPAFVVWKGKIKAGTVSQQLTHMVDLYPTLVGIAGGSLEQQLPLDGVDLKDVFLADKPLERKELVLYVRRSGGALRLGDWKIIDFTGITNGGMIGKHEGAAKPELFNLKDDPYEKNNLAESHPEKFKELHDRLDFYTKQAAAR